MRPFRRLSSGPPEARRGMPSDLSVSNGAARYRSGETVCATFMAYFPTKCLTGDSGYPDTMFFCADPTGAFSLDSPNAGRSSALDPVSRKRPSYSARTHRIL